MSQDQDHNKLQDEGGRRGEPQHEGGASKEGHLSPQSDIRGGKSEGGGQIAQDRQQSSGQGTGQT
ncbi:MAG TPA: hypothetical protein VEA44_18285 [Caulobacter sp.]|nr:hypothetical protein [Caulobacter sp.]